MDTNAQQLNVAVYQATIPSINYVLKNGKPCIFVAGKFATSVQKEIDELDEEVAAGHPHIRKCTEEETKSMTIPGADFMAGLKAKLFAEFLVEQEEAKLKMLAGHQSTYVPATLNPASSSDVATAASGGSGLDLAKQLAGLKLQSAVPKDEVTGMDLLAMTAPK